MILINSWFFDFSKMEAHRSETSIHYDVRYHNTRKLSITENGNVIGNNRNAPYDVEGFFSEPEDNFNEVINRAYADFMFEKQILEDNNESKRS